jgi:hypothetical protein
VLLSVRSAVGSTVRTAVGSTVRATVGSTVGTAVRPTVGAAVGSAVRTAVVRPGDSFGAAVLRPVLFLVFRHVFLLIVERRSSRCSLSDGEPNAARASRGERAEVVDRRAVQRVVQIEEARPQRRAVGRRIETGGVVEPLQGAD